MTIVAGFSTLLVTIPAYLVGIAAASTGEYIGNSKIRYKHITKDLGHRETEEEPNICTMG